MRRIFAGALLALSVAVQTFAPASAFLRGGYAPVNSGPVISPGWHTLKVGGGGETTGGDFQADGTKVVRTNTGNAYWWNGTIWTPLLSTVSMPGASWSPGNSQAGVQEIVIAPSATTNFFLHFEGQLLYSTNRGVGWTLATGFPNDGDNSNGGPGGSSGSMGPWMAVDPQNALIVWAGSSLSGSTGGLYSSTDGGHTYTHLSIAQVPAVPSGGDFVSVQYDLTSSVVGGKQQGIFACTYGTGCFHSTNGGTSFTSIVSGGPTDCLHSHVDGNGNLWCASYSSGIWRYKGTTWLNTIPDPGGATGYWSVAEDPLTPANVYAVPLSGQVNLTTTGNNTTPSWSGLSKDLTLFSPVVATDVPWLQATNSSYMTGGFVHFDPSQSHILYLEGGIGTFFTTAPTTVVAGTTQVVWNSQTAAQETLVVNQIIQPAGGKPSLGVWDRTSFQIVNRDAYVNPQTGYPTTVTPPQGDTWSMDWAAGTSPATMMFISGGYGGGSDKTSISTDGGTTWSQCGTFPSDGTNFHAAIAVGSATQAMMIPVGASAPYYTSNSCASWTKVTGLPSDGWGASGINNIDIAADRVTANTYYLINQGTTAPGIYTCTGSSCSLTFSGNLVTNPQGVSLTTVPGHAGHIFASNLPISGFNAIVYSTNGGVSWSSPLADGSGQFGFTITNVSFGPPDGGTYNSIYFIGSDGTTYGTWQCKNFNISTGACTSTWTNLGYPNNSLAKPQWVEADKNTVGLLYVAGAGWGGAYGYFP